MPAVCDRSATAAAAAATAHVRPRADLVRNQLEDTARVRGMSVEQVVEKVLLADQPTKAFVKPEELAAMVLHLCGPHSGSITGACISVDGGWTAR